MIGGVLALAGITLTVTGFGTNRAWLAQAGYPVFLVGLVAGVAFG